MFYIEYKQWERVCFEAESIELGQIPRAGWLWALFEAALFSHSHIHPQLLFPSAPFPFPLHTAQITWILLAASVRSNPGAFLVAKRLRAAWLQET